MSRVKYFLIFALAMVVIILGIKIENELNIKREIINAPIIDAPSMYLSFDNSQSGTINSMYGMFFKNREQAYKYCTSLQQNKEYEIVSTLDYSSVKNNRYSGLKFSLKLERCEDFPEYSICLDKNNCFIKYYGDE